VEVIAGLSSLDFKKKLAVFVNQELPILIEKGYLDVTEFRNASVTENCIRER
jgi:hypothetical protein